MNELALFAGVGRGLLASKILGWHTIAAVEIEPYCQKVLLQRQRDGILERFPIWDDVKNFKGKPWQGLVDIITGGFPCQGISAAGKGLGIRTDPRSGLWTEFARIIDEVKPPFAFIENSPMLVTRGLDIVLSNLTKMGYDARWCVLGSWHLGGFHKRDRIFILANSNRSRCNLQSGKEQQEYNRTEIVGKDSSSRSIFSKTKKESIHSDSKNKYSNPESSVSNKSSKCRKPNSSGSRGDVPEKSISSVQELYQNSGIHLEGLAKGLRKTSEVIWDESRVGRVIDELANRMDCIRGIGNGQVPQVVAAAFLMLSQGWI